MPSQLGPGRMAIADRLLGWRARSQAWVGLAGYKAHVFPSVLSPACADPRGVAREPAAWLAGLAVDTDLRWRIAGTGAIDADGPELPSASCSDCRRKRMPLDPRAAVRRQDEGIHRWSKDDTLASATGAR